MEQLVSVILSQNEQLNRIEHAISVFTLCEKHNHGDPLPKGDQDNINMVTELLRVALTSKAIVDERCVNFQLQIQQAEIERDLERQRLCDIISDMTSRCELKDASIQQSISRVSVLEVLLDTANRSLIVAEERCIQFTSREQAAVETQCTTRNVMEENLRLKSNITDMIESCNLKEANVQQVTARVGILEVLMDTARLNLDAANLDNKSKENHIVDLCHKINCIVNTNAVTDERCRNLEDRVNELTLEHNQEKQRNAIIIEKNHTSNISIQSAMIESSNLKDENIQQLTIKISTLQTRIDVTDHELDVIRIVNRSHEDKLLHYKHYVGDILDPRKPADGFRIAEQWDNVMLQELFPDATVDCTSQIAHSGDMHLKWMGVRILIESKTCLYGSADGCRVKTEGVNKFINNFNDDPELGAAIMIFNEKQVIDCVPTSIGKFYADARNPRIVYVPRDRALIYKAVIYAVMQAIRYKAVADERSEQCESKRVVQRSIRSLSVDTTINSCILRSVADDLDSNIRRFAEHSNTSGFHINVKNVRSEGKAEWKRQQKRLYDDNGPKKKKRKI